MGIRAPIHTVLYRHTYTFCHYPHFLTPSLPADSPSLLRSLALSPLLSLSHSLHHTHALNEQRCGVVYHAGGQKECESCRKRRNKAVDCGSSNAVESEGGRGRRRGRAARTSIDIQRKRLWQRWCEFLLSLPFCSLFLCLSMSFASQFTHPWLCFFWEMEMRCCISLFFDSLARSLSSFIHRFRFVYRHC